MAPLVFGPRGRLARHARRFDACVDAAFDELRGNPVADRIFYTASALGEHSLIWLALGALRGVRSEHSWSVMARVSAVLAVESLLVNGGIKSLFRRARPPWEADRPLRLRLRQPLTSSFPSGHATSAFTAAGFLSPKDPLWPLYYGLAIIVSLSRVHVKVHHASDLIGGAIVGVILGQFFRRRYHLKPPRPLGLRTRESSPHQGG